MSYLKSTSSSQWHTDRIKCKLPNQQKKVPETFNFNFFLFCIKIYRSEVFVSVVLTMCSGSPLTSDSDYN